MAKKEESKKTKTIQTPFKGGSRFGGSGAKNQNVGKSQYKPMPVRITQHKG